MQNSVRNRVRFSVDFAMFTLIVLLAFRNNSTVSILLLYYLTMTQMSNIAI